MGILLYNGAKTRVRTECGVSAEFRVMVGLHHGLALNHFLFVLVLDVRSESGRKEVLWELLYADELEILAERAD